MRGAALGVLSCNAGSSCLKATLVEAGRADLAPLHDPPGLETLAAARLAVDVYMHRVRHAIGALTATPDVTMPGEVMQIVGNPVPAGAAR